jgi:DinB family protein
VIRQTGRPVVSDQPPGSLCGVTITPDGKDWTWVLRQPCPECGFDTASFAREEVGAMLRANALAWQPVLSDDSARVRPRTDVWSPLEYGCHVRDVFRLYAIRLDLMLAKDDPLFANWDQDETAIAERYGEQDPAVVSAEVVESADALAAAFDAVAGDQWERTGRRSDGAIFTVESFARYFIHDPIHHLHDARN